MSHIEDDPSESQTATSAILENGLHDLSIEDGDFSLNENENISIEANTKTISMREYSNLIQLIPQVEELKKIVQEMEESIKKKNMKIQELIESQRCEQRREEKLSRLSEVSNNDPNVHCT